jgi:hypothetical protein
LKKEAPVAVEEVKEPVKEEKKDDLQLSLANMQASRNDGLTKQLSELSAKFDKLAEKYEKKKIAKAMKAKPKEEAKPKPKVKFVPTPEPGDEEYEYYSEEEPHHLLHARQEADQLLHQDRHYLQELSRKFRKGFQWDNIDERSNFNWSILNAYKWGRVINLTRRNTPRNPRRLPSRRRIRSLRSIGTSPRNPILEGRRNLVIIEILTERRKIKLLRTLSLMKLLCLSSKDSVKDLRLRSGHVTFCMPIRFWIPLGFYEFLTNRRKEEKIPSIDPIGRLRIHIEQTRPDMGSRHSAVLLGSSQSERLAISLAVFDLSLSLHHQ